MVAKSTDGGESWALGSRLACVAPFRVAVDPRMPDTLYASGIRAALICHSEACLFARSLDAGATWTFVSSVLMFDLRVDPPGN